MSAPLSPSYITGADDHLLANLFMLLDAAAEHEPALPLKICDFGFSKPVARFLAEMGWLLPKPGFLAEKDHPWYAKAAMADYLPEAETAARGFVWIDADIIPLGPFAAAVSKIAVTLRQGSQSVALCPDDCGYSLTEFIAVWRDRDREVAPFAEQLAARGISGDQPYLNTGFIVCVDPDFARAWRDLVLKQHVWLLFEQNSFNSLAYADRNRVTVLDTAEWNAHGALLDAVDASGSGTARFVHATSAGDRHVDGELTVGVQGKSRPMNLKLFIREDLRSRQLAHLERFMNSHADALIETGVLR